MMLQEKGKAEQDAFTHKENPILLAEANLEISSTGERYKRMLTEERGLLDNKVARVRRSVARETAALFVERMKAVEAKLAMVDQASDHWMYLAQAKANTELIAALEGGKRLEDEKKLVDS